MNDSTTPHSTEVALAQQLRYAEALAQCSRILLIEGTNAPKWEPVVERALATLRDALDCMRIALRLYLSLDGLVQLPEATVFVQTPEASLTPKVVHKFDAIPDHVKVAMIAGEALHGRIEDIFPADSPVVKNLAPYIKDFLVLGFYVNSLWRGHMAASYSHNEAGSWNESNIRFLRTAMEMIGAFVYQWETANALRAREIQLRALSDNLPNGFIYQYHFDHDGRPQFIFLSGGVQALLGISPEEVFADPSVIHSLIAPEDWERFVTAEQRALHEMGLFSEVLHHILRDGSERWLYISSRPRYLSDGSILCDGVAFDVTVQQLAVQELARARDDAEAATRAKSAFLATMSHELRTPLNAIIGMADLLQDTNLNEDQQALTDTISTAGQALLTIINDILDASRIEAGYLELNNAPFDLHQCLTTAVDLVAYDAQKKGLRLTRSIDPQLPRYVQGDEPRLRQILLNLLSNAVKFTNQGGVTLHAGLESGTAAHAMMRIQVQDTGIGIAAEQQHLIFEPFVQADSSTSRRYGGTGLGLSICQQLVTRMGGRIELTSRLHEGSTFTLFLPLPCVQAPNMPASPPLPAPQTLPSLHVLIAEDNLVNQELIRRMLERYGHRPYVVSDGHAAVAAVQQTTYDVILMDLQMPELDGITATTQIRSLGSTIRQPKIIALTANILDSVREQAFQVGMNGFLTKPVQPQELQQALVSLASVAVADEDVPAETKPLIDWKRFDALLRGIGQQQTTIFATIVDLFVQDILPQIINIEQLMADHDYAQLRRNVHRLRGGCLQIGAQALAALCYAIEQSEEPVEIEHLVSRLRPCYDDTLALLHMRLQSISAAATHQATPHCGGAG
ncbi:PAS domain-containing hybrid sensor histidine kinase/response regulator [Candidatus Viridilinea mediisalina]|nr:PAS domain-containing hybrid sensor histidine kinase/response regulator [Candidatus Viridilinea mediisalina]